MHDHSDIQSSHMPWTLIRTTPAPASVEPPRPVLSVQGPVHLVRTHYAKQNFIALPRSLWPRTVADVTNAPSRWGGYGFIFVWVERERTEGGAVVRERTLDSVYVQQSASTNAAVKAARAPNSEVAPEVREFIRALATRLAKDWAKETLRSSGVEGEVGP